MKEKQVLDQLFDAEGKPVRPWTYQQIEFIKEYMVTSNATQAALKAKYSAKAAKEAGYRLLTYDHIIKFLADCKSQAVARSMVSMEEVIEHQRAMAHSDIMDFLTLDNFGRPHVDMKKAQSLGRTKAVKSIEITELPPMTIVENGQELQREVLKVKLTLHDKAKTNEALMKHLGIDVPAPAVPPPAGGGSITNNFYMQMTDVDICKRMALLLYRGSLPAPPTIEGKATEAGAGSAGSTETSGDAQQGAKPAG